jgi:CheY-like chemotaxis protein
MNMPRVLVVAVTETGSAELALDLLLDGGQFDVVLCDMGLDGWSGADLYRRLVRRGDPHAARFVILSGLDVRSCRPDLAAELGDRLLMKPIRPAALLDALAAFHLHAAA